MKSVLITLIVVVTIALGIWCWSYEQYQTTNGRLHSAQGSRDPEAMQSALSAHEHSLQYFVLSQISSFADRHVYSIGVSELLMGDESGAAGSFASLMTDGTEEELLLRSHYNQGGLLVGMGQLEAAKEQYIRALAVRPEDVQAKINLELLLRKIEAQKKGEGDLKGLLEMRGQLSDVWLRVDSDLNGTNKQSRHLWR